MRKPITNLRECDLVNTIQEYKHEKEIIISIPEEHPIRLVEEPIKVGNLSVKKIRINFEGRDTSEQQTSSRVFMRYWKSGINSEFTDITIG